MLLKQQGVEVGGVLIKGPISQKAWTVVHAQSVFSIAVLAVGMPW